MALFLSTFKNKIDMKGRVSVPASFRNAVRNESFQGIVLYRSFTSNCIEGCCISRMEQISNATDNLELFSEEQNDITSLIFADARELSFDTTGRIIIPHDLLEYAKIKDSACFIGRGKTFQIWNEKDFENSQKSTLEKAKKSRPTLSLKKD